MSYDQTFEISPLSESGYNDNITYNFQEHDNFSIALTDNLQSIGEQDSLLESDLDSTTGEDR